MGDQADWRWAPRPAQSAEDYLALACAALQGQWVVDNCSTNRRDWPQAIADQAEFALIRHVAFKTHQGA